MPEINIYDKTGAFLEHHHIDGDILSWMRVKVPSYEDSICPPYSARLNGEFWPYHEHDSVLSDEDLVEITIEPRDPATWVFAIIAVVSAAYAYYQVKNLPDYQKSQQKGQSIHNSNVRANSIKPMGFVREMAGESPVFPDLICPIRRKYIDHQEYIYLMLAVTSGYAFLREDHIFIDKTPITNYFGDYNLSIFEPGDDVSGHEAHENWYESREIAQLKLSTKTDDIAGNWKAGYSGNTITVYRDGVLSEFPFPVDSIFKMTSGSNEGYWRVAALGSPNSSATIIKQQILNIDSAVTSIGYNYAVSQTSDSRYVPLTLDVSPSTLVSVSPIEDVSFELVNGGVNWEGPFQITPENETARYVEIDINFPGGLVYLEDDGDEANTTVDILVQYREVGSGSWTQVSYSYTGKTFDERGYTEEIDLGASIRPEFRFRRVTKDSDDVSRRDEVYIKRIRAKLETPTSYNDITSIALEIRGTNAISALAENKINIRGASRKLPTLSEIENAANGSPYDISASATQSSGDYIITDQKALIGSHTVDSLEVSPLRIDAGYSVSSNGEYFLAASGDVINSYSLFSSYNPSGGMTLQTSFAPATSNSIFRVVYLDNGSKLGVLSAFIKPPSLLSTLTVYDLSSSYRLDSVSVNSSYAPSSPAYMNDFSFSEDGEKLWLLDSGTITQYTLSTPFDLSTISVDQAGSPLSNIEFDGSPSSPSVTIGNSIWFGDSLSGKPQKFWTIQDESGDLYLACYSISGDISSPSFLYRVASDDYSMIQVEANYLYSGKSYINNATSPATYDFNVTTFLLESVIDSRRSRSVMRFIANATYDAVGSEAANIVNWDQLQSLDAILEARGDYLDEDFSDETTLWEMFKLALVPAYSEPAIKEGKFFPVRTAASSDYSHVYTPDFMLGGGLSIDDDHYDGQDPDGVVVEYLSAETGEEAEVECGLAGDEFIRPKRISISGVSDRTRAWRIGMRERRKLFYKPSSYVFDTEMDALNSEYGDPIAVVSDIFGAEYGKVLSVGGNTFTLDFIPTPPLGSPAVQYYAIFKKPNGRFSGLYPIAFGSPNNTVTITSSPSIDFVPITDGSAENTTITIADADSWGKRAICRKITPNGDNQVQVVAEEYVAEIFADDDNEPS